MAKNPGKKNRDGEYICLIWECGTPDAYYVRGHVDEDAAIATLEMEGEMLDGKLENGDTHGKPRHAYARWSVQGDAPDGCNRVLREYSSPGRGRFKVTVFDTGIFAKKDLTNETECDIIQYG